MERPQKYTIRDNRTGECSEQNYYPAYYLNNSDFTIWEDTRHEAKMRLFRYWQKVNGIIEPIYSPFKGTEIAKSIAILDF